MISVGALAVPTELTAHHREYYGEAAAQYWAEWAPGQVQRLLDLWDLEVAGATMWGAVGWLVPVARRAGGPRWGVVRSGPKLAPRAEAIIKIQPDDDETRGEPAALRWWRGAGAVCLLNHDLASGAMLLELLDSQRSLDSLSVPDAIEVIAGLLKRLHRAPEAGGRPTTSSSESFPFVAPVREIRQVAHLLVAEPTWAASPDRVLLDRCAALAAELLTVSSDGDVLLHGDPHYQNVLAALPGGRSVAASWLAAETSLAAEPWLAIDPKPAIGPPGYDLLPAIHNRWAEAEATGDPAREVLRRFDQFTEMLGGDPGQAAGWTVLRCLEILAWVSTGHQTWSAEPDRVVAATLLGRLGH